ncbi:MAG: radical SAM protein [bacterium]
MSFKEILLEVIFKNSNEKKIISLESLINTTIDFLEHYGEINIVGKQFYSIIGDEDGKTKFTQLLKAAGYENDPHGFFRNVIQHIEKINCYETYPIKINKIILPYLLVLSILEVLIPGNKFIKIKSVRQLMKLNNIKVTPENQKKLQNVIDRYPVRLSLHTVRQMRLSLSVADQYMPFVDELNREGEVHTWVGQFHRGIVEQMYQNRIIFVLNMTCPVYCRFCFRKHKECRNQRSPKQENVKNALMYVRISPKVKEVVLTGGDPFMNRATLSYAVNGLLNIPHIQTLRIATRSISYYPYLFYDKNSYWLNYLKRKHLESLEKGKRIEVATHFIHPDEVSIESLDIITELTQSGIAVYVQTPLLKDCNDKGPELVELYNKLSGAGAEMHYVYIPCSPIKGNRSYVTTISSGIKLASYLRAHLSDRAVPRTCTATHIGKIDWNLSGWAVEVDKDDSNYIWIRTPYTQEYFSSFAPILQFKRNARLNSEGTLDTKFRADIGDKSLLWGSRVHKTTHAIFPPERELAETKTNRSLEALQQLQAAALNDQRFTESVVPTNSKTLFRTHKTRVEMDMEIDSEELDKNLKYIGSDENITDIVVSQKMDVINSLFYLKNVFQKLIQIPHITTVRLRSHRFNYKPELFTHSLINQLGRLNHLSIANPKRLEIETQFLHSSEITSKHKEIAGNLRNKGITVYNNTPLLPFINDSGDELSKISYQLREAGIEFHHLYIAGLPIQLSWSREYPLDISTIIDIATQMRQFESGRGLPRFIIRSFLGEVDFGLTSEVIKSDDEGNIYIELLPYTLDYYQNMYSKFIWPEDIQISKNGHPIVSVPGLKRTREFLLD